MTIAADPAGFGFTETTAVAEATLVDRMPGLAIAAAASVGAGAIHAAAIGIHAEHPGLARIFVITAAIQLCVGLVALVRPSKLVAVAIALVNLGAVAGWLITRNMGVSWIEGLETSESAQFADTACAMLGLVAVGAGFKAILSGVQRGRAPKLLVPALVIAALTVPAMASAGEHLHSNGHGAAATPGHDAEGGDDPSGLGAAAGDSEHDHGGEATTDTDPDQDAEATTDAAHDHSEQPTPDSTPHHETANWPRPWDPSKPIDISGVDGVSAAQEARALDLIEDSLRELPKYATTAAAIADGFTSIGDAGTGSEHYIKASFIADDVILDATQPESLVYTVKGDERILAGAMYIASARPTDDPELVGWGGPLMQWHNHGDLCWDQVDGVPRVVGIVDAAGKCARGINTGGDNPMVHVWITPHECGVFAALEGVGAGQTSVSEEARVDKCQDHSAHGADEMPKPKPYDPTKPIDLSGTPGVTPEQQAAAENLIAVTVVRLPKWADYKVAEAAGFQSIGDGITGLEHYIQWSWINDDVSLDPDYPESLVYEPQPDGSKKLVSAMYMLADSVKLEDVPNAGGALMQWHVHDNLCYTADPVAPKVAGLTDAAGQCPAGLVKGEQAPMIHVWITPHKCGPFAALEGVGAGQIIDGETRLCDTAHGGH